MDRHEYLAAFAWAAVITAAVTAVSAAGVDILAIIVVWGAACGGGVLVLLTGKRRRKDEAIAQDPHAESVIAEPERHALSDVAGAPQACTPGLATACESGATPTNS